MPTRTSSIRSPAAHPPAPPSPPPRGPAPPAATNTSAAAPPAAGLRAGDGYNAYARAGLPVGPIANPGRDSIAAVLNPAETGALYFVADGSGGHAFPGPQV